MRNLFVFFLLGLALIHLSGATKQEEEKDISVFGDQEDLDIQELTESKKKKRKPFRRNKNKKRRGNKRKKARKNTKKRRKNALKKQRNNKNKEGTRVGQKAACETGCSEVIVKMMKAARKTNTYKKQYNRIVNARKIAKKKGDKKDQFDSGTDDGPLNLLIAAGGGNKSDLTCAGSKDNQAALNMKNLTAKLEKCKDAIDEMCNVTKKMVVIKPEWMACNASMTELKTASDICLKMGGVKACECFKNLTALITTCNKCNGTEMQKAAASDLEAKKKCATTFGDCRSNGEKIRPVLAACQAGGPSVADIKKTVGTVLANAATNTKLIARVAALIAAAGRKFSKRASVAIEGTTYDLSTCSGWADASLAWLTALEKDLETDISATGDSIVAVTPTCSSSDLSKLNSVSAKAAVVKTKSDKKIEILQNKLQTISGSTVSAADAIAAAAATTVAAAAGATTGTTAAAGGVTSPSAASTSGLRIRRKFKRVLAGIRDLKRL